MNGCIKTKEIVVLVQENGIIRNKNGRFLARLDDEIEFDGEHIIEKKMYSKEEVENMLFGITAILYKLMYDKDFRKKYAPDDLVVSSTLCWDNKDEDELIKDCLNKIREIKENL